MDNIHILIKSVKKNIISVISVIFIIMLILYSNSNLQAAKHGLTLWCNNVVPSLFPFFVATEILCSTSFIFDMRKINF